MQNNPPAPTRGIAPGPSSGTFLTYLTNIFPLLHEKKRERKTPLCKGSWPVGPEGLSSLLHVTRRNPLANANCNIASWLRHGLHHGPGGGTPPTGCRASGENRKKGAGGNLFPSTPFLFSLYPWCCFSSSQLSCGKTLLDKIVYRAPGAGTMSLPRGTGAA